MPNLGHGARSTTVVASMAVAGVVASATAAAAYPSNAIQGPSSSATPYTIPVDPSAAGVQVQSLLTTPDTVPLAGSTTGERYSFAGTPDGIGAYSNGDGTYTALVNHEFGPTVGGVRAHGSSGSYVSRLVIRTSDNAVLSGEDLMKRVYLGDPTTSPSPAGPGLAAFSRFCSADLPAVSAFYNSATSKGTQARIFMNGEETGAEGRAVGHVATGPDAGNSYQLPALGRFSWENSVANPGTGDTTAVAGTDDSSTNGQVYVYLGQKKATGATEVEKAGLTGGALYGVKVTGVTQEDRSNALSTSTTTPTYTGAFTLASVGDVTSKTGAQIDTDSVAAGVTSFLRPEDFTWDVDDPSIGYFQTTDRYDQVKDGVGTQVGRSRLWQLKFSDIGNLSAGGTITAVLDGTEGINMLDNLASSSGGKLLLLEDVGNQKHNGKVWRYDVKSDSLELLLMHDPDRFGDLDRDATAPFNQDEENSGIVDVSEVYGAPAGSGTHYLFDDQAHYSIAGDAVEGGQLMLLRLGANDLPTAVVPELPLAIGLPLVGFVAAGGAYLLRRRRDGGVEMA